MNHHEKLSHDKLVELILLTFDGIVSEEEFALLQTQIIRHQEARDCYFKLLTVYTGLSDYSNSGIFFKEPNAITGSDYDKLARMGVEEVNTSFDMGLWSQLAEDELIAPTVELPKQEERVDVVSQSERAKIKFSVNRSSIISLVVSAAAVIMIVLFARYAPPSSGYVYEVATLVDAVNAEWINTSLENDSRLVTGDMSWQLKCGVAELLFDNNARITIEGPAEFHIAMADQIALSYGRLYATVPPEAIGFTVTTPNSKIIDLGTEFGVEAGFGGTTELHVMQGETTLISGGKKQKTSTPVTQGVAKKISGVNGSVSSIVCDPVKFARKIRSQDNKIWRGENLKLASIVAGRDGFQEVDSLIGLNPATGEFTTSIVRNNRASEKSYNLVPGSKFIDGVFVPDGGVEQDFIPVTSMGHTFECSNTTGIFTHEIVTYRGTIENRHKTIPPAIFNGREYDNESVVVLHSNAGITFDLQAIRQSTGLDLKNFKSLGGLTEVLGNSKEDLPDVDFWILVDGQIRYEKEKLTIEDGTISFDVVVNSEDRFLTLIVTDGLRKEDGKRDFAYGNDFFCLIDPEFVLSTDLD